MPIERLLARSSLRPEDIARLNEAYRRALRELHVVDRNDPLAEIVAKRVIKIGSAVDDPIKISKLTVESLKLK